MHRSPLPPSPTPSPSRPPTFPRPLDLGGLRACASAGGRRRLLLLEVWAAAAGREVEVATPAFSTQYCDQRLRPIQWCCSPQEEFKRTWRLWCTRAGRIYGALPKFYICIQYYHLSVSGSRVHARTLSHQELGAAAAAAAVAAEVSAHNPGHSMGSSCQPNWEH